MIYDAHLRNACDKVHTLSSARRLLLSRHVKRQTDQLRSDPQLVACMLKSLSAILDKMGNFLVILQDHTDRLIAELFRISFPSLPGSRVCNQSLREQGLQICHMVVL